MKIPRYLLPAIALIALTSVIYWFSAGGRYYPVMSVTLPNNEGNLTFVERPWRSTEECRHSIRKMQAALGTSCTTCQIHSECTSSPDPRWIDTLHNQAIDLHVVQSDTLRILIDTPAAGDVCLAMARQINQSGKTTGHCLAPK